MARPHPETISPTAHYTGYVWFARGHSHEAFATRQGQLMYRLLKTPNRIISRVGLPSLEGMLLARHRAIDHLLDEAITAGHVTQIIEVATGLSPRGWRFRERYGTRITYVEADLPGMLENKRRVLASLGGETAHHRTQEIDALVDSGPSSIDEICASLDPKQGTAIITEGLVNYFDRATTIAMWSRFARALRRFPTGRYYSDLILADDNNGPFVKAFGVMLSAFVRGRVHMHDEAALVEAGFTQATLHDPEKLVDDVELAGSRRVKIVEAVA